MRVTDIRRYLVKSAGGERLTEVDVTPDGVEGDRGWRILDPATGRPSPASTAPC